ncbi:MAG: hypothetical protein JSU87_14525, partial [Gemmatimonadota bacterium]
EAAAVLARPLQTRGRRALGSELLAALEFAGGRALAGYGHLEEAEALGLDRQELGVWRSLVSLYGLGDERVEAYPLPRRRPAAAAEQRVWVRDTWLHGAVGLQVGDQAPARTAARQLTTIPDDTPVGVLASALAAGLRGELALAAGDTTLALDELRGAVRRYDELALYSAWETLPYYRYKLAQLEASQGNHAAAARVLRSFEDRSLGDVLFRKRAYLALGSALEAMGEASQASAAYAAAARW